MRHDATRLGIETHGTELLKRRVLHRTLYNRLYFIPVSHLANIIVGTATHRYIALQSVHSDVGVRFPIENFHLVRMLE